MKSRNNRDENAGASTGKERSGRNLLKLWMAFGGVASLVSVASAFKLLTFGPQDGE